MLLNVSPLISSGSHLSNYRAYKIQWKSNPILPSNVHSNSKLISYEHSQQRNTVLILWTALPQAYLGRIVLQKETTKSGERGTKTKWGILLRICRHKCQWLSKVWFKKALVDNKVFVHSVEVVWTYVDEAKCLTWHILTQSANSQSPQIEWGATGSTQTLQLWSNQGFPRPQHSSSRNFVRLASTKIIFSDCVR